MSCAYGGGGRLDWRTEVKRLKGNDASWTEVVSAIHPMFPALTEQQVREKVRGVTRVRRVKSIDERPVGVFSDPHIPFHHPNYLRFCADTFKKYGVGRVVCCGDLVDFHAISNHQAETCAKSPCDELEMTIEGVAQFVETFPDVDLILGNHDLRYVRQAASVRLDRRFLKSFADLFELPKTWRIHKGEIIINDVLYKHGINCTGKTGALNAAIQERMSTVIGHSHAFGGAQYSANKRDIIFGMNTGCGIDVAAYAFAYGNHSKNRPTLGCGVVFDSSNAIFAPMSQKYFRD